MFWFLSLFNIEEKNTTLRRVQKSAQFQLRAADQHLRSEDLSNGYAAPPIITLQ